MADTSKGGTPLEFYLWQRSDIPADRVEPLYHHQPILMTLWQAGQLLGQISS